MLASKCHFANHSQFVEEASMDSTDDDFGDDFEFQAAAPVILVVTPEPTASVEIHLDPKHAPVVNQSDDFDDDFEFQSAVSADAIAELPASVNQHIDGTSQIKLLVLPCGFEIFRRSIRGCRFCAQWYRCKLVSRSCSACSPIAGVRSCR
jgi:hypothetical protein